MQCQKKKYEAEELINSENLNKDEAKRYMSTSIRRGFATENGTKTK